MNCVYNYFHLSEQGFSRLVDLQVKFTAIGNLGNYQNKIVI